MLQAYGVMGESSPKLHMRHCVTYDVPDAFALPATVPFGQFDGLVSCRLVLLPTAASSVAGTQGTGANRLCLETVWDSLADFDDWENAFKNWLHHQTKVNLGQPFSKVNEKQTRSAADVRPWYRDPKNLWLIVANAGTVVAFLQLLQTQFDWFTASPDVVLLNPSQRLEFFEGELADLGLTLRNTASRGEVRVQVNSLELVATDPKVTARNVTFFDAKSPFVIPHLESGNSAEIPAQWTAVGPGRYSVVLKLRVEGGRQLALPTFESRAVDIYRDLKATKPASDGPRKQGPTLLETAAIPLSRGERRIRCQLECNSPLARIKSVTSRFQVAPIVPEDRGEAGSRAVWETVEIPNRMVLPVRFELESRPTASQGRPPSFDDAKWTSILESVHLYAEEAVEE